MNILSIETGFFQQIVVLFSAFTQAVCLKKRNGKIYEKEKMKI